MSKDYYENELYHHGIKGQKWGVRRFQDSSGRLTVAGKKRYAEYKKDYKEYKTLNRHVSAAQRHLKEEGVMYDRVRDTYQRADQRYRKEMRRGSGLFGLRAADKADRVARAQRDMDVIGKDLDAAANSYGFANRIANKDRKALGEHINKMLSKYGKGSVSELEYETVKIGQNKLQKIMQGAPVSSVFGRKRETDEYVKTGKTVADMPVIGNLYTSNYISNEEWKIKQKDLDRARNDDKAKRNNKKDGPEYVKRDDYFDESSSVNVKAKKKRDVEKAKDAAEKAAEEYDKLTADTYDKDGNRTKTSKLTAAKERLKNTTDAKKSASKQYGNAMVDVITSKSIGDAVRGVKETASASRRYKEAKTDQKVAKKVFDETLKETKRAKREKDKTERQYKKRVLHAYPTNYDSSNELYHYGVLGMKWGVHKARTYAHDVNKYRYKQNMKALKSDKRSGKISGEKYYNAKQRYKQDLKRANRASDREIGTTRLHSDRKVSSIYNKYKTQAVKEIPHYELKRGLKTTAKVVGVLGGTALSYLMADAYSKRALKDINAYNIAKRAYNENNKRMGIDDNWFDNASRYMREYTRAGNSAAYNIRKTKQWYNTSKAIPTAAVVGTVGKVEYDYRKTKKK